jgi:FtsP/CotA-like multicopper oxidase with cupredoxin domain
MRAGLWFCALALSTAIAMPAAAQEYDLVLDEQKLTFGGKSFDGLSINGSVPGPTLHFTEGEVARIHVTNQLGEPASIHWHGLLVPANMDGVPNLNGFVAIKPGETFTYRFRVKQSGTYWYHSHSLGQEQIGLYGAIIIAPKERDSIDADRDYVVMLSEATQETPERILSNLQGDASHYTHGEHTGGAEKGYAAPRTNLNAMPASPIDVAEVTGYTFLINGKAASDNWTGLFKPGERVRLRFIGGGAMTSFDVSIPGATMSVVGTDGQNVVPVNVDQFRIAPGETYDVIVVPEKKRAYTIFAEATDLTGYARGTLAPRDGLSGKIPKGTASDPSNSARVLKYADLKASKPNEKAEGEAREIIMRLGGSADNYVWTIDGHQHHDAPPIKVKHGERLRILFVNETAIVHPMHLHGMFFELDNGLGNRNPLKHTVIVRPGQVVPVFLTADAFGKWALHCHLLYHMLAGMMTELIVLDADGQAPPWY